MIKAVILDFDGTIGDTQSLIVRTMQQTIKALNLPARTDAQCAAMIGLPLKQTFTDLIPMDDATGDLCYETYSRLFEKNNTPDAVGIFPHVKETIDLLYSQGFKITIASSRHRTSVDDYLKNMGLARYISYTVTASETDRPKPLPDMVLMTLEALNLKPEEAIVVGDTAFDIRMAHAAGVRAIGVTYGNGSRESLEKVNADYLVDDFAEISRIVNEK